MLRQFTRTLATSARSLNASTSAAASSSASAAPADVEFALPYGVERSASGHLPVYSDYKNGGNNIRTIVRKIQGDATALRNDLAQYLADGHVDPLRPPPAVIIKPTSRQVEVKGRWVEEVKEWLESRGF